MTKPKRFVFAGCAVAGVCAVLVIAAVVVFVVSRRGGSTSPTAVTSTPDGQNWTLATQRNSNGTRVAVITDSNNLVVLSGALRFSEYSRWFVHGSAGEFWIYSGDIGILHYARGTDGRWTEQAWAGETTKSKMPRAFYSQLSDSSRKHIDLNDVQGP